MTVRFNMKCLSLFSLIVGGMYFFPSKKNGRDVSYAPDR